MLKRNNILVSVINSSPMQRAGHVAGFQKREILAQYQGEGHGV
jgi:hypothetical protein